MTVLVEDSLRLLAGRGVLWITDRPEPHDGLPSPEQLKSDARVQRMNVHLLAVLSAEAAQSDAAWKGVNGAVLDFTDGGFAARSSIEAVLRIVALAATHRARIVILDHRPALGGEQHDGPLWLPVHGSDIALPIRYGLSIGETLHLFASTLPAGADLHIVPLRGLRRAQFLSTQSQLPWTSPVSEVKSIEDALVASALLYLEGTSLSLGRGTEAPLVRVGAPWLDTKRVLDELADRPMPGVRFEPDHFTPHRPSDGKFDGLSMPGIRVRVIERTRVQTGRLALNLAWAVWKVHGDSLRLAGAAGAPGLGGFLSRVARGADPDSIVDAAMPALIAFQKKARAVQMYR